MIDGRPTHLTATGVVSATPAAVRGVVIGTEAASQTVKLHNCAATGDADAGNLVASIKTDTRQSFDLFGARFSIGVVAIISGGTLDVTVITD